MYDVKVTTSRNPVDCGATCLEMLLDYYGIEVTLKDIVDECNVGVMGCTVKNITEVGKKHELDIKNYAMSADELIHQDRPAIVWWRYNHFCVMCGLDENGDVVIINPDRGMYRLKPNSFKAFYSGVATFNGEPKDLPEEPEKITIPAEDYNDMLEIVNKNVEVFE